MIIRSMGEKKDTSSHNKGRVRNLCTIERLDPPLYESLNSSNDTQKGNTDEAKPIES